MVSQLANRSILIAYSLQLGKSDKSDRYYLAFSACSAVREHEIRTTNDKNDSTRPNLDYEMIRRRINQIQMRVAVISLKRCLIGILLSLILISSIFIRLAFSYVGEDFQNSLKLVMPEADFFLEKEEVPTYYEAFRKDLIYGQRLIGLCFLTTEVVPEERGYSGSLEILVGINLEGVITGIRILNHSETPEYTYELKEPWFYEQFENKKIEDKFVLGESIQGISGATITSAAVCRAVRRSVREISERYLAMYVEKQRISLWARFNNSGLWWLLAIFTLALFGYLKKNRWLRYVTLIIVIIYLGFIKGGAIPLARFINLITLQFSIIEDIFGYLLVFLIIITGVLLGRFYCGWLCPFGALLEWEHKLTPFNLIIPSSVDRKMRGIKYIFLAAAIGIIFWTAKGRTYRFEPFGLLFNLKDSIVNWVFLALVLSISLVNSRFWCKYLCPVGALTALISKISLFRIKLTEKCTACGECVKTCPMGAIQINQGKGITIKVTECILCNQCRSICPCETSNSRLCLSMNNELRTMN